MVDETVTTVTFEVAMVTDTNHFAAWVLKQARVLITVYVLK